MRSAQRMGQGIGEGRMSGAAGIAPLDIRAASPQKWGAFVGVQAAQLRVQDTHDTLARPGHISGRQFAVIKINALLRQCGLHGMQLLLCLVRLRGVGVGLHGMR